MQMFIQGQNGRRILWAKGDEHTIHTLAKSFARRNPHTIIVLKGRSHERKTTV